MSIGMSLRLLHIHPPLLGSAMAHQNCLTKLPQDRSSFTKGSKKEFLESFASDFLVAHTQGHDVAGKFYNHVAHSWLRKYGFDLPFDEDFEGAPPENDLVNDLTNFNSLDDDEIER